jgi:hypothetical protein
VIGEMLSGDCSNVGPQVGAWMRVGARITTGYWLLALAPLAVASVSPAQSVTTISPARVGHDLGIETALVAQFPASDDAGDFNQPPYAVLQFPAGAFLVVGFGQRVLLYDHAGVFQREVGRKGAGPGEFQYPRYAVNQGSAIAIVDLASGRSTTVGPRGEYLHSEEFASHNMSFLVASATGQLYAAGSVRSPKSLGYPIHVLSAAGTILRSFGPQSLPASRHGAPDDLNRTLALGPDGLLYAAVPGRYEIEVYTPATGKHLRSFVQSATWFPPHSTYVPPTPVIPPLPHFQAIHVDRTHLYTAILVPSKNWAKGLGEQFTDPGTGRQIYRIQTIADLYDTRVEAIDLATGEHQATAVFPGYGVQFTPYGDLVLFLQREDGTGFLRVESLRLSGRAKPQ